MNDTKVMSIINQILSKFAEFKVPNHVQLKAKHVDKFYREIKDLIISVKTDIENIESTFKQCDGDYHNPKTDLGIYFDDFVIEIFQHGIFDKELGEDRLTCIIELCLNCEEEKRYFISSLDKMYEEIVLLEKKWEKDKKQSPEKDPDSKKKYIKIIQSGLTNLLLTSTDKMPMETDEVIKKRTIKASSPKTSLDIILNSSDTKLTQQETKLLAVMIQKLTEGESGLLSISLTDLATRLGKSNKKKARESINASLNNLKAIDIKYDGIDPKGKKEPFSASLCQTAEIKNNIVFFEFETRLEEYLLKKSNIMLINNDLFSIKSNRTQNPYALTLGYKIYYQANYNRYKDEKPNNVFSMSVKSLLEVCQRSGLPSYKKVNNTSQHLGKLIISPIERDLNRLIEMGCITKWHYEDKQGNAVQDYIERANDNPESDSYSIEKNKKFSEWEKRNVIIEMPPEYLKEILKFDKKKIKKQPKLPKKRQ
jgi:hypothetical protein